jgi:hypothetical protein
MKLKTLLFLLILFFQFLSAQSKGWREAEIFMFTQGLDGDSIRYKMTAQGTVWDSIGTGPNYLITTDYNTAYYPLIDSLPEPDLPQNWGQRDVYGFNRVGSELGGYPTYGYGLYKLSVIPGIAHFYIDYRDTEIGVYPGITAPADIWIMYNDTLGGGGNGRFFYRSQGGIFNLDTSNWTGINNGDYIAFWEIKEQTSPDVEDFEDYWSNALCVVEQNNHPLLVWGPHPTIEYVEHFNLYRKRSTEQNYTKIYQTQDDDTTYYLDEEIEIITGLPQANEISVYYYVTASYIPHEELIESDPTDTVEVERGEGDPLEKTVTKIDELKSENFQIISNYPNPFNLTTTIEFSLSNVSNIEFVIFDVTGKRIKTIALNNLHAGNQQITWNGKNENGQIVSSGVYFYVIKVKSMDNSYEIFNKSSKLILLK